MALTPFQEDATCPKCGSTSIATHYQPDAYGNCRHHRRMTAHNRGEEGVPLPRDDEHIHRVCGRCTYFWREEVLTPGHRVGSQKLAQEVSEQNRSDNA